MTDMLQFDLVSPERLLMSEPVAEVVVPGTEGEFGVLAGHAPVMSALKPGVVRIKTARGAQARIFVRGGFADVTPKGLTILAEAAVPVEELSAARLDAEIRDAEEDVGLAKSDLERLAAEELLAALKAMRAAL